MLTTKPTVLVIDDTPEHIQIISNVLNEEYQVKAAINGERGLQIALQEPKPDLILLDIVMPEMNGFEVCKRLKSNPLTSAIPVMFLTAQSDDDDEQFGFDIGAVDYITKPISPAILRVRVRSQLLAYSKSRMLAAQVKGKNRPSCSKPTRDNQLLSKGWRVQRQRNRHARDSNEPLQPIACRSHWR